MRARLHLALLLCAALGVPGCFGINAAKKKIEAAAAAALKPAAKPTATPAATPAAVRPEIANDPILIALAAVPAFGTMNHAELARMIEVLRTATDEAGRKLAAAEREEKARSMRRLQRIFFWCGVGSAVLGLAVFLLLWQVFKLGYSRAWHWGAVCGFLAGGCFALAWGAAHWEALVIAAVALLLVGVVLGRLFSLKWQEMFGAAVKGVAGFCRELKAQEARQQDPLADPPKPPDRLLKDTLQDEFSKARVLGPADAEVQKLDPHPGPQS